MQKSRAIRRANQKYKGGATSAVTTWTGHKN